MHIEAESPRAAVSVDARIQACVENLKQFPEMGRPGRIEGTRELVISRTPYIAAYRIAGDRVRILRLLHGAQQWPDEMAGTRIEDRWRVPSSRPIPEKLNSPQYEGAPGPDSRISDTTKSRPILATQHRRTNYDLAEASHNFRRTSPSAMLGAALSFRDALSSRWRALKAA